MPPSRRPFPSQRTGWCGSRPTGRWKATPSIYFPRPVPTAPPNVNFRPHRLPTADLGKTRRPSWLSRCRRIPSRVVTSYVHERQGWSESTSSASRNRRRRSRRRIASIGSNRTDRLTVSRPFSVRPVPGRVSLKRSGQTNSCRVLTSRPLSHWSASTVLHSTIGRTAEVGRQRSKLHG